MSRLLHSSWGNGGGGGGGAIIEKIGLSHWEGLGRNGLLEGLDVGTPRQVMSTRRLIIPRRGVQHFTRPSASYICSILSRRVVMLPRSYQINSLDKSTPKINSTTYADHDSFMSLHLQPHPPFLHYSAESAFKALALAIKQAIERTGGTDVPSTKGVLAH